MWRAWAILRNESALVQASISTAALTRRVAGDTALRCTLDHHPTQEIGRRPRNLDRESLLQVNPAEVLAEMLSKENNQISVVGLTCAKLIRSIHDKLNQPN